MSLPQGLIWEPHWRDVIEAEHGVASGRFSLVRLMTREEFLVAFPPLPDLGKRKPGDEFVPIPIRKD